MFKNGLRMKNNNRYLRLLFIGILVAIVLLMIPIAKGFGTALAVDNAPGLEAQAGVFRAHADELTAWADLMTSLPNTLAQSGGLVVQIAIAFFVIALATGLASLLLSVSYNFFISGKIKYYQAQVGTAPHFAQQDNLLSSPIKSLGTSFDDNIHILGDDTAHNLDVTGGFSGQDDPERSSEGDYPNFAHHRELGRGRGVPANNSKRGRGRPQSTRDIFSFLRRK
jgi:hypothetical protein